MTRIHRACQGYVSIEKGFPRMNKYNYPVFLLPGNSFSLCLSYTCGDLADQGGSFITLHSCNSRNITSSTPQMENHNTFPHLPPELHIKIISHLTFRGLFHARGVNRFYRKICLEFIHHCYISRYVVPRIWFFMGAEVDTSWSTIQELSSDDIFRWSYTTTPVKAGYFRHLTFYLFEEKEHNGEIVRDFRNYRHGRSMNFYFERPDTYTSEKGKYDIEPVCSDDSQPIDWFHLLGIEGSLMSVSELKLVFKREDPAPVDGGGRTTCTCIRSEVKLEGGVETVSWEIEMPLFLLYRYLRRDSIVSYVRAWNGDKAWWHH
jgi:hypothetical protein